MADPINRNSNQSWTFAEYLAGNSPLPMPNQIANAPIITGTLAVGNTLGFIAPTNLGYTGQQWNANGTPIAGATGTTYTLTSAEAGKAITITLTGIYELSAGYGVPAGLINNLTFAGPAGGVQSLTSNKFFVGADSVLTPLTFTPSDGGAGGTFNPTSVTLTSAGKKPFTYTPVSIGTKVISLQAPAGVVAPSYINYTTLDSSGTIFTEGWASLANWASGANPQQVSGGRVYGLTNGGGAGMNHSYAIVDGTNLRAVFPMTVAAGSTVGGIGVGVNFDAAGATPSSGAANCFLMYFDHTGTGVNVLNVSSSFTQIDATLVRGNYIVTVTVDPIYISILAEKTDGTKDYYARRLRAGVSINNLHIFNSDTAGTGGSSIGPMSARKALQTIVPRIFGENVAISGGYTGNSGTAGFMYWLPVGYDSTLSYPVVIMFHGDGSNETAFVTDPTYPIMRRAYTAAGYIVISCGVLTNNSTWGAPISTDAYFDAYRFINDNYKITNVVFHGCSMGGIESLNTIVANKVPGIVAWIGYSPTTSLARAYATSWTAKINTAYNISGDYAIKTAGFDPLLDQPSQFRSLPMLFAAATDDTIVGKSFNTDPMITLVTGTAIEVVSIANITGNHSYDPTQVPTGSSTSVTAQMIAFADKYAK